jgi:hypothetical protein
MSSRTCPEWPQLMELAPELQFKHYTLREAQLPADALVSIEAVDLDAVALCCDLACHVFFVEHTEPAVAEALRASHWFDLREWVERSPGADAA